MKRLNKLLLTGLVCALGVNAQAAPARASAASLAPSAVSAPAAADVPAVLVAGGVADQVIRSEPSPIAGLNVVTLYGGKVALVSADGKYLIDGRLLTPQGDGLANVLEPISQRARLEALAALPAAQLLEFKAADEKAVIYAFTDTGCPYCQHFHREVRAMNRAGITLRYLPFPRQGLESADFQHLATVWCADDPHKAIDLLMNKQNVEQQNCKAESYVAEGYKLGRAMGIQGTPSLILPDGSLIGGARDAATLLKLTGLAP